jgi:hypothetical protein
MVKRYRFWFWLAVGLLFLTALVHTTTLFLQPAPQNDTERQLLDLLANYKQDFGAGFQRTMKDIFRALSACFSLVCSLGGLTLCYLGRKHLEVGILKGIVGIHVLVFGICFGVMAAFTFLPPIVLTGLIFLSLLITYLLIPRQESSA